MSAAPHTGVGEAVLGIDRARCDGSGLCAHLAPDVIAMDRWGFPLLPDHGLDSIEERQARRAVRGCPARALFLSRAGQPGTAG